MVRGARWCSAALGGARRYSAVLGGAFAPLYVASAVLSGARRWSAVLDGAQRCSAVLSGAFVVVGGGRHAGRGACAPLSAVEVGGGLCVVLGGRRRRSGRRWGLPGSGGGLAVKLTLNTQPYTPLTPTHGSALTRASCNGESGRAFCFRFLLVSRVLYIHTAVQTTVLYSTGYNGINLDLGFYTRRFILYLLI